MHLRYSAVFCLNAAVQLVIVFIHNATAFGDFSYVSDIMSRQLTFCERVIASLLCVIFDIYRSQAYVYCGL